MPRADKLARAAAIAATLAGAAAMGTAASARVTGPSAAPAPVPAGALAVPVAVFGSDDRTGVPGKYWRAQGGIGLIYNKRSRTVCTAFCVADNIVATAGHCIYRTAGETAPPIGSFAFTRARGVAGATALIAGSRDHGAAQNVVSGGTRLSVKPPIDAASDWALIRLERPVCTGHVLELRAMSIDDVSKASVEKRLFQLSYHRDYADWRLAYSQPCNSGRMLGGASAAALTRDFNDPANLILHTCDTGGASSGSPLLVEVERGPVVVGMNVGTYVQSEVVIEDGNVVKRSKAASVANTAVSVLSFRTRLAAFEQADVLPNGARMRALQHSLNQRRLYDGAVDGRYGAKLREAIIAYEQAAGLTTTGIASQELANKLAPAAPKTTQRPAASARPRS